MEQPSSSSCTVRVAKMPAAFLRPPSARDELSAAATQFGGADKVAVLHSKRCALLELPSAEAAAAMVAHHAAQPLVLGGKPAVVSVEAKGRWEWSTWEQSRQLSLTDDERVAKECAACVALLVARLEEDERRVNAARRKEEHTEHLAVLTRVFSHQRFDRASCWRHHRHPGGGGCDYVTCQRSHVTAGLPQGLPRFCCAPPSQREFVERDTFPAEHREAAQEKARVNAALVALAASHRVSSPRCLVLDGPGACTVKALRLGLGRHPSQMAVPNTCTQTYSALQRPRPLVGQASSRTRTGVGAPSRRLARRGPR